MAPIYPPANETKAINLTPSMQAYYTTTNGAGTRYAACRVGAPRACDTGAMRMGSPCTHLTPSSCHTSSYPPLVPLAGLCM